MTIKISVKALEFSGLKLTEIDKILLCLYGIGDTCIEQFRLCTVFSQL